MLSPICATFDSPRSSSARKRESSTPLRSFGASSRSLVRNSADEVYTGD